MRLRALATAPVPTCPTYIDQFNIKIFLHFSISPSPTSPSSTPSTCLKSRQPCFPTTAIFSDPCSTVGQGRRFNSSWRCSLVEVGHVHTCRPRLNGHFWRNLSGVYRKKTPTNLLVNPEGLLASLASHTCLLRPPPTERRGKDRIILELWMWRGRVGTYSVMIC